MKLNGLCVQSAQECHSKGFAGGGSGRGTPAKLLSRLLSAGCGCKSVRAADWKRRQHGGGGSVRTKTLGVRSKCWPDLWSLDGKTRAGCPSGLRVNRRYWSSPMRRFGYGLGFRVARKSKSPVGLNSNWPRDLRWTEVASVNHRGRYGRSSARIFWTSLHRTLRLD